MSSFATINEVDLSRVIGGEGMNPNETDPNQRWDNCFKALSITNPEASWGQKSAIANGYSNGGECKMRDIPGVK